MVVATLGPPSPSSATIPQPNPSTTINVVPLSPPAYLKLALDFIEQNALRRAKVNWPAIRGSAEQRGNVATTVADTYPIIVDTLKALGDRHSSFQPPPQATQLLQGKANSYGFVASFPQRIVVSLSTGGPAEKAGLKLRDRIDLLQGRKVVGVDGAVAVRKVNGEFPKVLKLVVTRPSAEKGTPTKRLNISISFAEVSLVQAPKADPVASKSVGDRLGYLELPGLVGTPEDQLTYAQQAHDAMKALSAQSSRCGWVVDLRRNRGGYIFPMLTAAGPLLAPPEGGVVGGKIDARDRFERWVYGTGAMRLIQPGETQPGEPLATVAQPFIPAKWDVPVAVLTSSLTASAGEGVTLAFRSRPNTRSFGEPTTGLTTNNVLIALPDNALVIVTNATLTDRTGESFDGPIAPDQPVAVDYSNIATANDPVLKAATTWLSSQLASQSACV
jgi:carboxyl-terminal processing protease